MDEAAEKAAHEVLEQMEKEGQDFPEVDSLMEIYGRRCYHRGKREALPMFKGKEVFDPSVVEKECTRVRGISAIPSEGEEHGQRSDS